MGNKGREGEVPRMDRWRPFSYTQPPPVSHICYTPQLSDKLHAQLPDMHRHATRGHNSRPTCYSSQICYMPQLSEDMLHATTLRDMLHAATVRHTLHATTKTLAVLLKCQTYASRHTSQTCKRQQNVFISPRLQSAWRGGGEVGAASISGDCKREKHVTEADTVHQRPW